MRAGGLALSLVASILTLFASGAAEARPTSKSVRIVYRAAEGCPTELTFWSEILARTQRVRPARTGEPARTIEVALEGRERVTGRLSLVDRDGRVVEREVDGEGCVEVASALALIAALALDPTAAPTPTMPDGRRRDDARSGPIDPTDEPGDEPGPDLHRVPARARFAIGVSALVATNIAPAPLVGAVAFVELSREARDARGRPGFSPAVRLGVARSLSGAIDFGQGSADVSLTTAVLDVRPWSVRAERFAFVPAVALEIGALHVDGEGIPAAAHPTRPWAAIGAGAGASLLLYGPLFLDATAIASLPFIRDSFTFAPDPAVPIVHASVVGFRGALGLGVRFP